LVTIAKDAETGEKRSRVLKMARGIFNPKVERRIR